MSVLFEKTNIKGMELRNRLVRSATHEAMADDEGFPTDRIFKLYERLAKGGVGLIITGYTYVTRICCRRNGRSNIYGRNYPKRGSRLYFPVPGTYN
jgi:2,4-dienoyl-CoA reductase-like NADH-dependent reductase (Old Yellow Enzyme family)